MPLTPKPDKDVAYEYIFFLHDCGHHLLLDLVFTGKRIDPVSRMKYVIWRLIGEGTTFAFMEMIVVRFLSGFTGYKYAKVHEPDHPYRFFKLLEKKNEAIRKVDHVLLHRASCLFFTRVDPLAFDKLLGDIDQLDSEERRVYDGFMNRYQPVAERGYEWTSGNFDNLVGMAGDYRKWFESIKDDTRDLRQFRLIEDFDGIGETKQEIFDEMFRISCDEHRGALASSNGIQTSIINSNRRKNMIFKRMMLGNLLLLSKKNIRIHGFLERIRASDPDKDNSEMIEKLRDDYASAVDTLYEEKRITCYEQKIYRELYITIPPNILKK